MKTNGVEPGPIDDIHQLDSVLPGDAVDIWMETAYIVKTVFKCREDMDGTLTQWRWIFLDDGSLIEVSPDGYFRYREHRLFKQGSDLYEELVAQDGALVRFEERVREGTSGRRPVQVTIDGKQYRISSTGTFAAERAGAETEWVSWNSINRDPAQNVYFGLIDTEDEDNVALGIWTSHVCLSFGQVLEDTSITAIYRRQDQ